MVLLLRNFLDGIALNCNFISMQMIPLSTYQVLWNCKSLFATVISHFWLREPTTTAEKTFALVAFVGMVLVVKPNLISSALGIADASDSSRDSSGTRGSNLKASSFSDALWVWPGRSWRHFRTTWFASTVLVIPAHRISTLHNYFYFCVFCSVFSAAYVVLWKHSCILVLFSGLYQFSVDFLISLIGFFLQSRFCRCNLKLPWRSVINTRRFWWFLWLSIWRLFTLL